MNIYLNSRPYSLVKEMALIPFLEEIKIDISGGIAVAINDIIIPKSDWTKTTLSDNDKITLIKAAAGG